MAVLWEKLVGDTRRFAVRLAFGPDPHEGRGTDGDLSLSWGSFQLWVEGRNLCAHVEEAERTDSVHWYLLPLMEWFAQNWNPLFHEERLPTRNAGSTAWRSLRNTQFPPLAIEANEALADQWESSWQSWWHRHALRSASDGGLLPDVIFRRWRDRVEISWGNARSVGAPAGFDFLEQAGESRLEPEAVTAPLHEVLREAAQYLALMNGDCERFNALRHTLQTGRRAGQRQERLAWLAGLGTDVATVKKGFGRAKRWLADVDASSLVTDARFNPLVVTGSCRAALMFGCVAPDVRREDAVELARIMVARRVGASNLPFGDAVPVEWTDERPWAQGYGLAEDFIDQFGLSECLGQEGAVDVERILSRLEVDVVQTSLTDEAIRGVAVAGPKYLPCIAWNDRSHWNGDEKGRRFTLAHELCHVLFDQEAGRGLAIASGPWAPLDVERRANAFAAMLLMPTAVVQEALARSAEPISTPEGIRGVANRLHTSFGATLRHLTNLGFIDEHERQRIAASA